MCNLTETMRGDRKEFKWTIGAVRSFKLLKKKVIEQLVLALPNFNKVFQVDFYLVVVLLELY